MVSSREPAINAPWPVVAVIAGLAAAFAAQTWLYSDATVLNLALSAEAFRHGRWQTLVTYQFLHGGLMHLIMNSAGVLAFGAPVLRLFGGETRGALLFFAFFLLSGVIAGVGLMALPWNSDAIAIGASGAVCGLWGAASRMLGLKYGLAPIISGSVLRQAVVFAVLNLGIALLGRFVGLSLAWEAHLFGYAFGLLSIGIVRKLVRPA